MIKTIRVELLGGLTVWADGVAVLDSAAKINKPWQVFCFLVLNRGVPSSGNRLIRALWPDEDHTDPANVLKNTIYALRREFKTADSTRESPILYENGGYICNPNIEFVVDTDLMEQQIQLAAEAEGDERMARLNEAVNIYKGELLPQLELEAWVMPLALYYRKLFSDSVDELCRRLFSDERYSELLAVATQATRIDPLEESYYLYTFRALYALEMYRAIIPAYNKTSRLFSEELGVPPGQELRHIYEAASEKVDSIEQDIMIIKNDLRDSVGDTPNQNGPLYCTYDVFKYLYQMVARSSERSGSQVSILLLTLRGANEEELPAKVMSAVMAQLKSLIMGGLLRKSDTVARYSKSQYIIMLTVEHPGGVERVVNRIQRKTAPMLEAAGMEIVFGTTEMGLPS